MVEGDVGNDVGNVVLLSVGNVVGRSKNGDARISNSTKKDISYVAKLTLTILSWNVRNRGHRWHSGSMPCAWLRRFHHAGFGSLHSNVG